ncbi:MAG: tyrosine recombinase XerC [Steroidobacteraceae bacterium]
MSSRRGRGEGSVHYDTDRARWVGVIDLGTDPDSGKRQRRKVSALTKTAARMRLDELRAELQRTGTVAPRDVTLAVIMQDWTDHPPSAVRSPISRRVHQQYADRITKALGNVPVHRLTTRQVESMLQDMADEGLATATIAATRSVLRRALRRAQRDGLASRNVAELADVPHGTVRKSRSMTLAQVGQLLASDMTPWWRAFITTGIMCGLRPGELLGLTWDDIDLDAGTISVNQSLHDEPGNVRRRAGLKTGSSRRVLRLPDRVIAVLRVHKAAQAAVRLKAGARWKDHGFVFPGPAGELPSPRGVRDGFRRRCSSAGIGTDWHPHEMRHTWVSVLKDAGLDIEAIAAAAGHENSNVTKRTYLNVIAPEITTAATAMDSIFGTSPDGP